MVQWVRLGAFTAKGPGPRFSPLVGELRSYKPCGVAKKKRKKEKFSLPASRNLGN